MRQDVTSRVTAHDPKRWDNEHTNSTPVRGATLRTTPKKLLHILLPFAAFLPISANSAGAQAITAHGERRTQAAPSIAGALVRQVVDDKLGGRYGSTEREAVGRCVTAALAQAAIMYGVNGYAGTEGYAAYVGAYRLGASGVPGFPGIATQMRVTQITAVQRRADGMRVKGLIDSGVDYLGPLSGAAYQGPGGGGQAYATAHPSNNDLAFRCNLGSAGLVSSMRVERNTTTYRRY